MPIMFDRGTCCDLHQTISREWLITNSIGGYAAGTVAGVLTRKQHGLLVALPPGATTPQLLLAKIDEEVVFDQRTFYLGTNEYRDGTISPSGFVYLETFRLEEGFPVFTYHLGGPDGIMLEKRIWMPHGCNTTFIQYRVFRVAAKRSIGSVPDGRSLESEEAAQRPLTLTLLPFAAHRSHHQSQYGSNDWHFQVRVYRAEEASDEDRWTPYLPQGVTGCSIHASDQALPYHIMAVGHSESHATFIPTGVWYWNFLHRQEVGKSQTSTDDFYLPGVIRATLWPSEEATLTIIISAEELSTLILSRDQLRYSYQQHVEERQERFHHMLQAHWYCHKRGSTETAHLCVLPLSTAPDPFTGGEEFLHLLLQAGDRYLERHKLPYGDLPDRQALLLGQPESISRLLSDYYHMESKTRDTLIALPGLTLATERYDEALRILRSCAQHFREGLLPELLPLPGEGHDAQDYGAADTTLWFFYALDHYLQITHNYEFLEEFYLHLQETINAYIQGAIEGVYLDPEDGLLVVRGEGPALTWMNAQVDGKPITRRAGKPVEVNALWYHALSLMHEWSLYLYQREQPGHFPAIYQQWRQRCRQSFQQRFWYAEGGYLYDLVDGPDGNDFALRPNQLLALSLRHAVLNTDHRQSVFDAVTQYLLTPYGLRTLAPTEQAYCGQPGNSGEPQASALHQGSVHPWLLGPYIDALLTMHYQPSRESSWQGEHLYQEYLWRKGLQLLEPFRERLNEGILGMCPGIFAGDAPHLASSDTSLAMNIGELLRIYSAIAHMRMTQPDDFLSRQL